MRRSYICSFLDVITHVQYRRFKISISNLFIKRKVAILRSWTKRQAFKIFPSKKTNQIFNMFYLVCLELYPTDDNVLCCCLDFNLSWTKIEWGRSMFIIYRKLKSFPFIRFYRILSLIAETFNDTHIDGITQYTYRYHT